MGKVSPCFFCVQVFPTFFTYLGISKYCFIFSCHPALEVMSHHVNSVAVLKYHLRPCSDLGVGPQDRKTPSWLWLPRLGLSCEQPARQIPAQKLALGGFVVEEPFSSDALILRFAAGGAPPPAHQQSPLRLPRCVELGTPSCRPRGPEVGSQQSWAAARAGRPRGRKPLWARVWRSSRSAASAFIPGLCVRCLTTGSREQLLLKTRILRGGWSSGGSSLLGRSQVTGRVMSCEVGVGRAGSTCPHVPGVPNRSQGRPRPPCLASQLNHRLWLCAICWLQDTARLCHHGSGWLGQKSLALAPGPLHRGPRWAAQLQGQWVVVSGSCHRCHDGMAPQFPHC